MPEGNQKFFYPLKEKTNELHNVIDSGKLQCIDEPIELYGDFNTASAKILFLTFVSCNKTQRKTCKSDREVKEWLKDKYLVMAYNKYTFISDEYKERSFKYQSALDWFPIDIAGSIIYPFKV
jgi:hypothetical protein